VITYRITLFDTPEDDEFDGEIGDHDDEVPRALLNFRIENFPQAGLHAKMTHVPDEIDYSRERNLANNSISSTQNPNSSWSTVDRHNLSLQENKASPPRPKEQMKVTPSFENITNERDEYTLEKNQGTLRSSGSPSKSQEQKTRKSPSKEKTFEEDKAYSRIPLNQSADINMDNLEQKIGDLIYTLQNRKQVERESYDPTYDMVVPSK
jgi:hypothetical protein